MPVTIHKATPGSVAELADCVAGARRVHPHGARTKPRLADAGDELGITSVDVSGLKGIVDYDPGELLITARAGTPMAEIEARLAGEGQSLSFDPMFVAAGCTLGGTLASSLSGPGRQRRSGIRGAVAGVEYIDPEGRSISARREGAKNAEGFDFSALLVGSFGRLGVIHEATLKTFPTPGAFLTASFELGHIENTIAAAREISLRPVETYAIHIAPPGNLLVRVGGDPTENEAAIDRIEAAISSSATRLRGGPEIARWEGARDCTWARGRALVKIPTTLSDLSDLDATLGRLDSKRRYNCAGNVAFASFDQQNATSLSDGLSELGMTGIVLRGETESIRLGDERFRTASGTVKGLMDPGAKFLNL